MCPILLESWNIALTKTHRNQNMIAHHHQHQKLQSAHLETRQHVGPFGRIQNIQNTECLAGSNGFIVGGGMKVALHLSTY
jgi:hypothetical protein